MPKRTKHRNIANPDLHRAMHGLRSSSAAQPHTPTPRKGTRRANKTAAIREFA